MNFKDEYRAANEQIHGDRTILAGITEKPKKIIYFKPAVGIGVAAAVCAVTILAYPYINLTPGNEETPVETYDVSLASEQEQGMPIPDMTEEEQTPAPMMRKMAPETTTEPASEPVNTTNTYAYYTEADDEEAYFTADAESFYEDASEADASTGELQNKKQESDLMASAGSGGSAGNVKYVFAEDRCAVVVYDENQNVTKYAITAETVFVNRNGEVISRDTKGEIVHIETQNEIIVKVVIGE